MKRPKRQKIKGLGNASCMNYNYGKTSHEKTERKARKTTRKWCRKDRNELYVSGHPRRRTSENVVGKRRARREEGARRQVRQKGRVH